MSFSDDELIALALTVVDKPKRSSSAEEFIKYFKITEGTQKVPKMYIYHLYEIFCKQQKLRKEYRNNFFNIFNQTFKNGITPGDLDVSEAALAEYKKLQYKKKYLWRNNSKQSKKVHENAKRLVEEKRRKKGMPLLD